MNHSATIIANFGGPRTLQEIGPFLETLLSDQDVVRTPLPESLHRPLFRFIARHRSKYVAESYKKIGGKSPIYADTEALKVALEPLLKGPVLTFHRYLPGTHAKFLESVRALSSAEIRIFPMFPQFTYATTGSVARWFQNHFPASVLDKMRWIKSYPAHPAFIQAQTEHLQQFLDAHHIEEHNTVLLFTAHGIPQRFVRDGDPYQEECEITFRAVSEAFPQAHSVLCYQSKLGPGRWLSPYTETVCKNIHSHTDGKSAVVFVPISFTSDHFETLFEIEQQYMPIIRERGLVPYRTPALRQGPTWVQAIDFILKTGPFFPTEALVRKCRTLLGG